MADFQYLAPDMPDFLKQVTDANALNQDVPFHLQPPVFTRFDHPTVYNYNPEPQTSRGCKANQGEDLDEERYNVHVEGTPLWCDTSGSHIRFLFHSFNSFLFS